MYLKWLLSLNHTSLRKSILCPVLVGKFNNNQNGPAWTTLLEASPKQPNRHTVRNMSPVSIYLLIMVHTKGLLSFLFLEVEYGFLHNELTIFRRLCGSLQEKRHPSGDCAVWKFPVVTFRGGISLYYSSLPRAVGRHKKKGVYWGRRQEACIFIAWPFFTTSGVMDQFNMLAWLRYKPQLFNQTFWVLLWSYFVPLTKVYSQFKQNYSRLSGWAGSISWKTLKNRTKSSLKKKKFHLWNAVSDHAWAFWLLSWEPALWFSSLPNQTSQSHKPSPGNQSLYRFLHT